MSPTSGLPIDTTGLLQARVYSTCTNTIFASPTNTTLLQPHQRLSSSIQTIVMLSSHSSNSNTHCYAAWNMALPLPLLLPQMQQLLQH
jgi:hypothetical protein